MDSDTNSIELSSSCSCVDCDTLRCFTRKRETFNDETGTCIFFTNVSVKIPGNNTDTAINETTPAKIKSAQETCQMCRRRNKNENNLDTVSQRLINEINTIKYVPVCESCMKNINKIKQQTSNEELAMIDAKSFFTNDTKPEQRPMRKSKCKICVRDFQNYGKVVDLKTETTPSEKITTIEGVANKSSKSYFSPTKHTEKSKVCKQDIETWEYAEGREKINKKKSQCKFCERHVDPRDRENDLVCNTCKAYIPSNMSTDAGNTKVGTSVLELCPNYVQKISNKNSRNILDPVQRKCKRCKNCIDGDNGQKTCILCRGYVDSLQEMVCNICKICKAYFPGNLYTNVVKSEDVEIEKKGMANFESDTSTKDLERRKLYAAKIATISSEKLCPNCRIDKAKSDIIATEDLCTGKSKCKVCRRHVDEWEVTMSKNASTYKEIIPLCEFCRSDSKKKGISDTVVTDITSTDNINTRKLNCKDFLGDIEEWETAIDTALSEVNGEITPTVSVNNVTSLCQLCRKGKETKINTDKIFLKKSNSKLCRRDDEDWEVHFIRKTPSKTINKKSSQCHFCRMDTEKQGTDFDNRITSTKRNFVTKGCIKDIKMSNHSDTFNTDFTLLDKKQNSCVGNTVELSNNIPVSYNNRKKSCNCKKSEIETIVCSSHPLRENIHPSTLKLSAQIMNVPYEEFKDSLNQQSNYSNKATMKSTLSNDIIKRIKEAYKACSCKVCECIIGKSLVESNDCDCKPCDCADCKSFKQQNTHSESKLGYHNKVFPQKVSVAKTIQEQPCGCTPCSCIRCTQISIETTAPAKFSAPLLKRSYIAARVSENRHTDNCTCPACHCTECERNFFSLSTHVTHEMATGMMSNCRCEQCVDQRCRGAGGTDDCRCDIPSKAIFKPVEKDSHDYGIHRAAVCHQRNKRNDFHDAIAMYATVSSNYLPLGKVEEGCNCDECERVSHKGKNNKILIKTILKPQSALQMRSIKTNTCDCKACECENCSYGRNVPDGHLVNYQHAECNCEVCDCIECQRDSKSITTKLGPLAKPIGKIYYRNYVKEYPDCDIPFTRCPQAMCEKNRHGAGIKAMVNKNSYNNTDFDKTQKNKYNRYCCLDSSNSILAKTCSVSKDLAKHIPPQSTVGNKYCDKKNNKLLKYTDYRGTGRVVKGNTHCDLEANKCCSRYNKILNSRSSAATFSSLDHAKCDENNENGKKMINLQPCQLTLSSYKADCPKTTLENCLKDILTLDDDLNFKMSSKFQPNIAYNITTYDYDKNQDVDDIDVYDYMFEPFSNFHHNIYNKNLSGIQIYEPTQNDINNKYKIKNKSNICIIPSVVNDNNNLVKNQIDYARVHNTLREAKAFSEQLIKLLDKYERANRDFQSVSEKLKLSHESSECNKLKDNVRFQLDYVVIEKQNNIHDNNESVNRVNYVNDNLSDINISSYSTNYASDNSYNRHNAIILVKGKQNEHSLQNKVILVEKERQSEHNENLTSGHNYEIKKDNAHRLKKTLTTTEAQIVNIDQITSQLPLITTNNEDKSTVQSSCKAAEIEDKTNSDKIRGKVESIQNNIVQGRKTTLPCGKNTRYEIDILTDQLSKVIKENVIKNYEESISGTMNKYDATIEITGNDDFLSKQKDDGSQGSMNRTNFHLNNLDFDIPPYGLKFVDNEAKANTHATSAQASLEKHLNKKCMVDKIINQSGSSLPRNRTTQVDKESDTRVDYLMGKSKYQKPSGSTLKSSTETESDQDTQSRYTVLNSNRHLAMGKAKCSCEFLKVGFLGGRRVSDHTVMVKWSKPKDIRNVQGYELLVDGRPVQTIIDSSRCMAVVTCLPNSEKVLLTMKTILIVATKSGHEPSVTIVYHPRLKKNKNKTELS